MLAKFSKLPGFSALLQNGTYYPQEAIDSAIAEIKRIGKSPINGDESLVDIQKILTLMKKYTDSIHVARVACHALSNLAMQVVAARWIIQKGGFQAIRKTLLKYHADHKLCWLASSAIWNLARPPANRAIIGREGGKLMLQILAEHSDKEKVTNTAIGALSNLSLLESLKDMIAKPHNLKIVLDVMNRYVSNKSISVMTSGAGLLANIAVSDAYASLLVDKNALPILLELLRWKVETGSNDETLFRNTCAALNNLVTADGFLDSFLEGQGIECVLAFLKHNESNQLYDNLLENCLVNIDADSSTQTTSFHLSCFHGKLNILQNIVSKTPQFDLNQCDERNMTCLDYAITQNHGQVVEFLARCGAVKYNDKNEEITDDLIKALRDGQSTLEAVKEENNKAIEVALPAFPSDLCKHLVSYTHNIDLLNGMNMFEL